MKAAVFNPAVATPGNFVQILDVPTPALLPNHVLLRVLACGVCRTDLHIVERDLPPLQPTIIPGHQIVGEIVDGATPTLPIGARVGVSWMGGTDGTCRFCTSRAENLCDHPIFTGYTSSTEAMPRSPSPTPTSSTRSPLPADPVHVVPAPLRWHYRLSQSPRRFESPARRPSRRPLHESFGQFQRELAIRVASILELLEAHWRRHPRPSPHRAAANPPQPAHSGPARKTPVHPNPLDSRIHHLRPRRARSSSTRFLLPCCKGGISRDQRHPPRPDARLRLRFTSPLGRAPDSQCRQYDPHRRP